MEAYIIVFLKKHDYANSEYRSKKLRCSFNGKNDNFKLGEKQFFW